MSFSKARIQRFNELTSQVPPPGAYDPKFDSKVKGSLAKTSTTPRFPDAAAKAESCAASASGAASVCSRASSSNAPSINVKPFRTPQVPRKRAVVKPSAALSCPRAKAKLYQDGAHKGGQYEPQQELADLKVELDNKDKTIAEYEKLLEDVKIEASRCRAELQLVEEQRQRDIESLVMDNALDEQHRAQLRSLREELLASQEESRELKDRLCALERASDEESLKLVCEQVSALLQRCLGVGEDDERESTLHMADLDCSFVAEIKQLAADLKLRYEREIELSRDRFNEERENLEQQLDRHRAEIHDLQRQLSQVNEANHLLSQQLDDAQKLCKETSRSLQHSQEQFELKLSETNVAHQSELADLQSKHYEQVSYLHGLIEDAKREYLEEVDKLEKSLEEEKRRMKECADKMIENAEAVTRETLQACRAESEERVRRIVGETEAKIREAARLAEEKESKKRERVDKEVAALTSSLSAREQEVSRLTLALEEMKCAAETQESFSQSLQAELDRAEAELVEKKEELRNLKDQLRNESAEMVARRRRLEMAMAENQASVGALAQRLAHSQADNEALQCQLRAKEAEIQECRELLETVRRSSQTLHDRLHDQLQELADGIERKLDCVDGLEGHSLQQIERSKSSLIAGIDQFKSAAVQQLVQAQQKSKQNAELKANLRQMSERLNDATEMLLRLEQINDEQSLDVSRLQLQISKLEQQLHEKNRQIRDNDATVREHEAERADISEQLASLQRKHAQLQEEHDQLKELASKYENQLTSLPPRQQPDAADAAQTRPKPFQFKDKINIQQVDLLRLGQQDTNDSLDEISGQLHEKLKLEARRQIGMGKENHCSAPASPHKQLFPKSANTTPVSSPGKHPATPLRARND